MPCVCNGVIGSRIFARRQARRTHRFTAFIFFRRQEFRTLSTVDIRAQGVNSSSRQYFAQMDIWEIRHLGARLLRSGAINWFTCATEPTWEIFGRARCRSRLDPVLRHARSAVAPTVALMIFSPRVTGPAVENGTRSRRSSCSLDQGR